MFSLPTPRPLLVATLLAAVGSSVATEASPLEDPLSTAVFAGPAHPHATSIFHNPAALGLAPSGKHFFLGGGVRASHLAIDRSHLDIGSGSLSPGPGVRGTPMAPSGLLAFYRTVGDRGAIGFSIHTPFSERFLEGGEALGYHTRGGHLFQAVGSVAGAYRASNKLLFGLGLSLGYASLRLRFARDSALAAGSDDVRGIQSDCAGAPCGVENPAAAEMYDVQVSTGSVAEIFQTRNLALSGGVAYAPRPNWWIALGYTSPPGALGSLNPRGQAAVEPAPRDGGPRREGQAEVFFRMPHSVQLGVRGPALPGYEVVGGARWQGYSRQDVFDVRLFGGDLAAGDVPEWYPRYRGLRDVWQLHVGLEREPGERFRYGGRLRYETGAVSRANVSPLSVYGQNLTASGGVELQLRQDLVLGAGYDLSWFPRLRSAASAFDPRDRLACVDSGHHFDVCESAREGRATPTAAGSYRRLEHALVLSIRYHRL